MHPDSSRLKSRQTLWRLFGVAKAAHNGLAAGVWPGFRSATVRSEIRSTDMTHHTLRFFSIALATMRGMDHGDVIVFSSTTKRGADCSWRYMASVGDYLERTGGAGVVGSNPRRSDHKIKRLAQERNRLRSASRPISNRQIAAGGVRSAAGLIANSPYCWTAAITAHPLKCKFCLRVELSFLLEAMGGQQKVSLARGGVQLPGRVERQ